MRLKNSLHKNEESPSFSVAIAAADNDDIFSVVKDALQYNLASFCLFGNEEKLTTLQQHYKLPDEQIRFFPTKDEKESAHEAVKLIHEGGASILMKGHVPSSVLLKAALHSEYGLRTGKVLSHVAVFDVPTYERPLFLTDSAMNVTPSLEEKVGIIENAVSVARTMGLSLPKVAPIAAVEVVNPKMPSTVDAALLTQMNRRNQIKHCLIDGPLALDNAISIEAAERKGIQSDVGGRADILLVPNVEMGNTLYKSLVYFAKAEVGGFITGGKVPIVLTSRTDTKQNKLYSLALALHVMKNQTRG
ncbi:phosphate butyryltransferase [Alkalihalobacillus sp. LMS39]|uniref:phosphate butyryltransferase n=1 Tax=Alkalihalobacillus sp. LMS39 TaxID=2924032 RepID=UPI001FB5355A|nr:phosphate butyryltransferase [Alkalihalobacillus sp. LMS39]UOE95950.1 phosphate butyryltransferase [Alkalihalobacillus sp. LMS39]